MRVLGCLLLLAAISSSGPGRLYVTSMGRRVLHRTDQVVEARVLRIQPAFRGITTARLQVIEHLLGFDRSRQVTLLYVDDLAAPDAFGSTLERSSIRYERRLESGLPKFLRDLSELRLPRSEEQLGPRKVNQSKETGGTVKAGPSHGVRLAKDEQAIFFLERKGATYSLVGLVPEGDALYDAKRKRLRQILKLEGVLALDLRARQAKRFFLRDLSNPDPWPRGNSAREILNLALRFPEVFGADDGRKLAARLFREREPPIQAALERALRSVDPRAALAYAAQAEEQERARFAGQLEQERRRLDKLRSPLLKANDVYRAGSTYGRAATGLVALYLEDPEAIVRLRAAQTLAEFGGPSCRPALREALDGERDKKAAAAMIYACGIKSDPQAVGLLAARLSDRDLERSAIFALARIGTPQAWRALARRQAASEGELAGLIASLLREEFKGPR